MRTLIILICIVGFACSMWLCVSFLRDAAEALAGMPGSAVGNVLAYFFFLLTAAAFAATGAKKCDR